MEGACCFLLEQGCGWFDSDQQGCESRTNADNGKVRYWESETILHCIASISCCYSIGLKMCLPLLSLDTHYQADKAAQFRLEAALSISPNVGATEDVDLTLCREAAFKEDVSLCNIGLGNGVSCFALLNVGGAR